ncbi:MAG: transglycosylase SLT domain-containing protein, partial [Mariprofundales bacterium]|nr:transglycosylase SLT domain-containing protein [Mariprofundales bacterium]
TSWIFTQQSRPKQTPPHFTTTPNSKTTSATEQESTTPPARGRHFGRMVWMKDITSLLQREGVSAPMSQEIARWLMIYCRHFRIPPDVALAIIYVESSFDRFAVSVAGAQGLMQVMPFWRDKIGTADDNLFNVEVNIRYGCAILRHYLDRYRTLDVALSAYNGSIGSQRYARRVRAAMRRFGAIPTLADLEH